VTVIVFSVLLLITTFDNRQYFLHQVHSTD